MTQSLFETDWPNTLVIPCISLWSPWAEWVALGWKGIETRLHARFAKLRGRRIAIHASHTWDKTAFDAARPYLDASQMANSHILPKCGGRILCTVRVDDTRWLDWADSARALIDCGTVKRFGLILSDVRLVPDTIPAVKGCQGQFGVTLPREFAA